MTDPYAPPSSNVSSELLVEYAGFWRRAVAQLVDGIILMAVTFPPLYAIYGEDYFVNEQMVAGSLDFFISWVFPPVAIIAFWKYRGATPGKMLLASKIIDAKTGGAPSTGQLIGRYFSYIPSALVLSLGFLWVAVDKRKQGWHDKLAGTVVVRTRS